MLSLVSASKSQGSSNTGNLQQTSPNLNVDTSCLESLLKDSSESVGLGWGLRFCVSNKFLDGVSAAGGAAL